MSATEAGLTAKSYSTFETRKGLIAAYNEAPVDDGDRTETEANFGRCVLAELPMPWPYKTAEDQCHRLALRVVYSDEITLEVGDYDFGPIDVELLRQGIDAYDRAVRGPAPLSRESLRDRLAAHVDGSTGNGAESNDLMNRALAEANKVLAARESRMLAQEERRRTQPERLAQARAQAEDERIKALAAEPWADVVMGIPSVDFSSMLTMPTIAGKELFGARLAFDLLGTCADEEQVAEKLREYLRMVRDPAHMFLVCAAALDTIANYVVPALVDIYEQKSGDYDTRVRLADAARNAWTGRVADLQDGMGETAG